MLRSICCSRPVRACLLRRTLAAAALVSWLAVPAAAAPPSYVPELLDPARLGTFDELLFCCSLNNLGQILGSLRRNPGDGFAEIYLWDPAADTVDILPVVTATNSLPMLTGAGHVLGRDPVTQAEFYWVPGTGFITFEPDPVPGAFVSIQAFNDVGQVVIERGRVPVPAPEIPEAFTLWLVDVFTGEETLIDADSETVVGVNSLTFPLNDLGQLALGGELGDGTPVHFWDPEDGLLGLPFLPGSVGQIGNGVNDLGQVVGDAGIPTGGFGNGTTVTGAFWEDVDAVPTELPCIADRTCQTSGISNRGQIYGFAQNDDDMDAVEWVQGEPFLAADLADPQTGACVSGLNINDLGQRTGLGLLPAPCISHAVPTVEIESPEPDAVVDASELLVTGIATDEFAVASVVVNGVEADLAPANDPDDPVAVTFQVVIPLVPGANEIVAVATDVDGNTDEDAVAVQNEGGPGGDPRLCDVNGDDVVDSQDVDAIFAARGENPDGPDDPRDANEDGVISINDARLCVLECDLPECETPPPPVPRSSCGLLAVEALPLVAWLLWLGRTRGSRGRPHGGRR